jgi:ring-1,2-phenylacetyl-CoA epoxidase subunit PaaD
MDTEQQFIYELLRKVEDPELPVNIVDLGIVETVRFGPDKIEITLTPTFSGCPALEHIRQLVLDVLREGFPGKSAEVSWSFKSSWTSQKISSEGEAALKNFGIAVADNGVVHCPYCASEHIVRDSPFGSSLCREIYYCSQCKNPFEKMKHLA